MGLETPTPVDPVDRALFSTNAASRKLPIHRWFNFIAGFSPEFVSHCIAESEIATDGGYLLDPFAGAGTALLSAQIEGVRSVGYEAHPFFAEMARAKLATDLTEQDVESVRDFIGSLLDRPRAPKSVWEGKALTFLEKLVPDERLARLAGCPAAVTELPQNRRPIFHLMVSRILEAAAGSSTDGIYKAPTTAKRGTDVHDALETLAATLVEDLRQVPDRTAEAVLHQRSSATPMPPGASLCVTSPPYLNNFDFAEMTRMELYFWKWASSWAEITATVRSRLLTNTTTAPREARFGPEVTTALPEAMRLSVDRLYRELEQACQGRSKDYHRLAFPYFDGLHRVLSRVAEALLPNAAIHVVVADSAFYGVHVPLQDLVAQSLTELGFAEVTVEHLRVRGDRWVLDKRKGPAGSLGEYWVSAVR